MAKNLVLTMYQAGNYRIRMEPSPDSGPLIRMKTGGNLKEMSWLKTSTHGYYIDLSEMKDLQLTGVDQKFINRGGYYPCSLFKGKSSESRYVIEFSLEDYYVNIAPLTTMNAGKERGTSDKVIDLSEVGLSYSWSELLEDTGVDKLPVIGGLIKSVRLVSSLRDNLFARKIKRFLFEVEKTSEKDREKLNSKLGNKADDMYESLLNILDRCEEIEKSAWIGKIFCAVINNKISSDECLRLCSMVSRGYAMDIKALSRVCHPLGIDIDIAESLIALGLLTRRDTELTEQDITGHKTFFELNKYGSLLRGIIELE